MSYDVKEKTSLEKLIEELKVYKSLNPLIEVDFVCTMLEKEYMSIEKEQIKKAFQSGKTNRWIEDGDAYFFVKYDQHISSDLKEKTGFNESESKNLLDTRIDELDLSLRSYNVLYNLGVKNLGQMACLTKKLLYKSRNCGEKTVNEIVEKLAEYSLEIEEY